MGTPGPAPARLGRYELLARLASGGMGEIFLARLEGAAGFEKLFVVKRILPHLADDARFRQMLIAEARLASLMTHANICQVYELGETDGQLYLVMEYLEGITLLPLLRKLSRQRGSLDLGFIGGVIQQVTDGLHHAHELRDRSGSSLGIVHRDVTPSNLFVTEAGVVKVLDFGIAKVKDASAHTQTGTVKGKYAYMSPEQLRGAAVDRRADVFALGVVMYEMLSLRRLFQRKTDYLTFRAVMEQPITDIRSFRPDCPDPLADTVVRALDRDPDRRFATARQLGSAVLDAIRLITRPWTQGEISDFVRASFASDIETRSSQVAHAVTTGPAPDAMPQIAQPEEALIEIEEDSELGFPSVESVSTAPAPARERRSSGKSSPVRSHNPGESPPIVVVSPRRSLLWPLLAFAMLAVAGGALFLVWQQMQNQRPTSLVITGGSDSRVTQGGSNVIIVGPNPGNAAPLAERGAPDAPDLRAEPGPPELPELRDSREPRDSSDAEPLAGKPADPLAAKSAGARKRPAQPDRNAVLARQVDAERCATEHGNPPPGTRLTILVAPDGHPRSVTLTPASVDATPLGTCIKRVFRSAVFPRGPAEHKIDVNLVPPR